MRSKFVKVECACGNKQNIFSHVSSTVKCTSCSAVLAQPRGGDAVISGKVVEELG